jgi:hypothetical protein
MEKKFLCFQVQTRVSTPVKSWTQPHLTSLSSMWLKPEGSLRHCAATPEEIHRILCAKPCWRRSRIQHLHIGFGLSAWVTPKNNIQSIHLLCASCCFGMGWSCRSHRQCNAQRWLSPVLILSVKESDTSCLCILGTPELQHKVARNLDGETSWSGRISNKASLSLLDQSSPSELTLQLYQHKNWRTVWMTQARLLTQNLL